MTQGGSSLFEGSFIHLCSADFQMIDFVYHSLNWYGKGKMRSSTIFKTTICGLLHTPCCRLLLQEHVDLYPKS